MTKNEKEKYKAQKRNKIISTGLIILAVVIAMVFLVLVLSQVASDRVEIIGLFEEADFNISSDFTILWEQAYYPQQYEDTDWYYWEVDIFNKNSPFLNGELKFWLNIESMTCCYEGEIPT